MGGLAVRPPKGGWTGRPVFMHPVPKGKKSRGLAIEGISEF